MKLLNVFACSALAATVAAQGSQQDAEILIHCQGSAVTKDNRDGALKQLEGWCDAGNKMRSGEKAEFKVGGTTAFFCVYDGNQGCNSTEIRRFVGGMKAFCPGDDQGASCLDRDTNRVFGYNADQRNVCGDDFTKGN